MQSRPRGRSSTTAERYVRRLDLEDIGALPTDLAPWQIAAIREGRRRLAEAATEYEQTPRMLREADSGMPAGRVLVASGRVHTLYKAGGGFIQILIPGPPTATCEEAGCCDPRKTISAGRE